MKPAPPAASKPTVAWTPLDNYFALHAVGHTAVLASADDLAELVERRKLFEQLAVTLKFSIVWGIDGAAVTSAQARRILGGAGSSVDVEYMVEIDVTVDGQTRKSTETRTRKEARREPPVHPRLIRPEARPGLPERRRPYDWLEPDGTHRADLKQNYCRHCADVITRGADAPTADADSSAPPAAPHADRGGAAPETRYGGPVAVSGRFGADRADA